MRKKLKEYLIDTHAYIFIYIIYIKEEAISMYQVFGDTNQLFNDFFRIVVLNTPPVVIAWPFINFWP